VGPIFESICGFRGDSLPVDNFGSHTTVSIVSRHEVIRARYRHSKLPNLLMPALAGGLGCSAILVLRSLQNAGDPVSRLSQFSRAEGMSR